MRPWAFAVAGVEPAVSHDDFAVATGLKGTYNAAENVFKVSKPRDDVKVNVDGSTMPPFMRAADQKSGKPKSIGSVL